ncbi:MAG: FtsX-like permease family protein [Candidatus Muirbacterium halophilum]|nr:FtsX-like permease family protein [Candidatus Muirbacterium halophilum]MCK9477085.1 FtsX-like permease family protein [Candidatus Muirbacterium halophilum]
MLLNLAWKNMFRHKIRTILTASTIFAGVFITLFANSLTSGITRNVINKFIHTDIGIIRILPHDLYEDMEEKYIASFSFTDNLKNNIKKTVNEEFTDIEIAERIFFPGQITNGISEIPIMFYGIDKDLEERLFKRKEFMVKGNYLGDSSKNKVIMSIKTAKLLDLKAGDFITIMGRDSDKSMNAIEVEIAGLFNTDNVKIDNNYIYMTKSLAWDFIGRESINEIIIYSNNIQKEYTVSVFNVLENKFGKEADIITWYEELHDFIDVMIMKEGTSYFVIMIIILLMAGFGIANTLIMAVYERKKEIGILYAMGLNRKNIVSLFMFEGTFIGVLGGGLGGVLAYFTSLYFSVKGFNFNIPEEMTESLNFSGGLIYTYLPLNMIIIVSFVAILTAVIASLYPAWFATRLKPAEIIRQ